jgi:oxygen-independent coproporphyrinogen III oxidase
MMTTNSRDPNQNNRQTRSIGLYIHLPFCQRKCNYCGFLSLEEHAEQIRKQYVDNLLQEIELRRDWLEEMKARLPRLCQSSVIVDSIFIGGGTPSLFEAAEIQRILDGIRASWQLDDQIEITMESNPNSLSHEKLIGYRKAGVNRLSIGIQSFDDGLLSQLGRLHDAKCGESSILMAKEAGFSNINLDFMFGLPGQRMDHWISSLQKAISLDPNHLSLYTLQIEEGTNFYRSYKSGALPLMDESLDRACYHQAIKLLNSFGYRRYEISNFAKAGQECRHNLKYWSMDDYLGFGLGASSYLQGNRWSNRRSLAEWTDSLSCRQLPIDAGTEKMDSKHDEIGIFMFTGLRKTCGVSLLEFEKRFGEGFFHVFASQRDLLEQYRNEGLIDWSESKTGNLWLTESGIDVSNQIMAEFV